MFLFSKIRLIDRWPVVACAVLLFSLAVGLTAWRTYTHYAIPGGEFDWSTRGLSDFHNGTYYPSTAFFDGVSPYSPENASDYRMARAAPTYSPVIFMLHWPLTLLDVRTAGAVNFLATLLCYAAIVWLGLKMTRAFYSPASGQKSSLPGNREFPIARTLFLIFAMVGLIVISRPGHITLFTGYFTAELVLGTLMAIHYARTRPVISGVGMLLASGKPTFALPLIFLLICRRNFTAVFYGILFCVLGGGIGLAWLAYNADGGLQTVLEGIRQGQQALHQDPTEFPVNLWTRTDIPGVIAKFVSAKPDDNVYLASMFLMLLIPGYAIWQTSATETNAGGLGLTGLIICVSILLCIYHHAYECLLLAMPWFAVTFCGKPRECTPRERVWLAIALGFPSINYLSTISFRDLLGYEQLDFGWKLITALNTVFLLVALFILIRAALRYSKEMEAEESASTSLSGGTGS